MERCGQSERWCVGEEVACSTRVKGARGSSRPHPRLMWSMIAAAVGRRAVERLGRALDV